MFEHIGVKASIVSISIASYTNLALLLVLHTHNNTTHPSPNPLITHTYKILTRSENEGTLAY